MDLEAGRPLHLRRQLRMPAQPGGQVVVVVHLPDDAAIGVDRHARDDPHAALVRVAAELLRRLDPAMRIAQEAVDRDRRDPVHAHEIDDALEIGQESVRRLVVRVHDADFLHADLVISQLVEWSQFQKVR